jgi:ketosteroid isomerase-like protein
MKTLLIAILVIVLAMMAGACGPTQTPTATPTTDPAAVVTAYYVAVNAKDLDAAMALVADDATFTVLGLAAGVKTGKTEIRAWLQGVVDHGNTFEVSNFQVTGDTVTFSAKVLLGSRQVASAMSTAIVQKGHIKSLQEK